MVLMDDQNKNLILATVLSFLVILGWFVGGPMLFPQWFPEEPVVQQSATPEAATTTDAAPLTAAMIGIGAERIASKSSIEPRNIRRSSQ